MDAGYGASTDRYGLTFENGVVEDMRSLHDAYFTKPVKLKDGVYPMIFGVYDLFGLIIKDFIAEYYVSGGSLFSGKLGQKVFNENLSVYTDSNPKTAYLCEFFDAEGEIAPESPYMAQGRTIPSGRQRRSHLKRSESRRTNAEQSFGKNTAVEAALGRKLPHRTGTFGPCLDKIGARLSTEELLKTCWQAKTEPPSSVCLL